MKLEKPVLRRNYSLPKPHFESDDLGPSSCKQSNCRKPSLPYCKAGRREPPATSVPGILAQLTRQYSAEQLRRVPPVFMSAPMSSVCLAEPYALTLKRAAKAGQEKGVILDEIYKEDLVDRESMSKKRVAFGKVQIME